MAGRGVAALMALQVHHRADPSPTAQGRGATRVAATVNLCSAVAALVTTILRVAAAQEARGAQVPELTSPLRGTAQDGAAGTRPDLASTWCANSSVAASTSGFEAAVNEWRPASPSVTPATTYLPDAMCAAPRAWSTGRSE